MNQSPLLLAEGVTKLYGSDSASHAALRGIDFSAQSGEFVAIRGPSGCGKSTLLHILGAMDRPTDGKVWLNGDRLDTLTTDQLALVRRKRVGFVFQAFNLLPTLNVQENVSLPLLLDGVGDREASGRAAGVPWPTAIELLIWSGREDLNLRPPEPHSGALPGCATPRVVVGKALCPVCNCRRFTTVGI